MKKDIVARLRTIESKLDAILLRMESTPQVDGTGYANHWPCEANYIQLDFGKKNAITRKASDFILKRVNLRFGLRVAG